jgi:diphthamide biosynthesis protein 2
LRTVAPPEGMSMADCALWFIGEEGRGLMNLQMQNADSSVR